MTDTTFPYLPQLTMTCKRLGLVNTAALVEAEQASLVSRWGEYQDWRVSPRAVPPWLTAYVDTLRAHRGRCERLDDIPAALGFAVGVSVLARAVTERVALTPENSQRLLGTIQNEIEKAFERITFARGQELSVARMTAQNAVASGARAEQRRQERARAEADVATAKARLAALAQ